MTRFKLPDKNMSTVPYCRASVPPVSREGCGVLQLGWPGFLKNICISDRLDNKTGMTDSLFVIVPVGCLRYMCDLSP